MENTLENKAKFFALYWGQGIILTKDGYKEYAPIEGYPLDHHDTLKKSYLELTPLSQITEEDAVEVLKIFKKYSASYNYQFTTKTNAFSETFRQVYSDDHTKDGGYEGIDSITVHGNFSDNGLHALQSNRDETYWQALDYLRSKGYALPFLGVSVETLVEWGWIRLKQSNG